MLFTSLEFICLFFVAAIGINYLLPKGWRNGWLFLVSLFFYAWGEPRFVLVMLLSILVNYILALCIEKRRQARQAAARRLFLLLAVTFDLGLLFVFKYLNFTTAILHGIWPSVQVTEFVLPIGISFFTFQVLSYVVDVYRGEHAQRSIVCVGLYISLFPQLIAGPIVRYQTIRDALKDRAVTAEDFRGGLFRFLRGFNKKLLLANTVSVAADAAFAAAAPSVLLTWLGAVCYTLQIFFDFSGYSDMAIGMGRMLGFHFPENFNYPYISKTVTEFWRRWHISLGTWFRDYLYFPLGGSRVRSRGRLVLNLAVVWLATGIWHGANRTFIVWGCMYGVIIIAEKLLAIPQWVETCRPVYRIPYQVFTMLMVVLGWVIFRSDSIAGAVQYIRTMFGAVPAAPLTDGTARLYLREYAVLIAAGILCATPLCSHIGASAGAHHPVLARTFSELGQILLFLCSISYLVISAYNPFIYFNF